MLKQNQDLQARIQQLEKPADQTVANPQTLANQALANP